MKFLGMDFSCAIGSLSDGKFPEKDCLLPLISKLLGYCIVAASTTVKLPQVKPNTKPTTVDKFPIFYFAPFPYYVWKGTRFCCLFFWHEGCRITELSPYVPGFFGQSIGEIICVTCKYETQYTTLIATCENPRDNEVQQLNQNKK